MGDGAYGYVSTVAGSQLDEALPGLLGDRAGLPITVGYPAAGVVGATGRR